ncbi:MAG: DUF169 domain-containing protein [Armatimonadota bacterium]|nr:DUF169 domain-containing protein [Armatimonadota bacterium]
MTSRELISATRGLREMLGLREDPLVFFYTDHQPEGYRPSGDGRACLVALLGRARRGETVYFDREHFGCGGAGYYLGFAPPSPTIDEFVSTGIPGKMEGEHYKKSPDLVRRYREENQVGPAPAAYAVFKPIGALTDEERPQVVLSFVTPDELSGLVMLANYARAEDAVVAVFSSGCGGLVTRALKEAHHAPPRAVLGMFDPSARPFVPAHELSFSAPIPLWEEMLAHYQESFLKTATWAKVRERIRKG